jgi:xylulose-5-phosphate/fructose-6-phosphate phosphoketolase
VLPILHLNGYKIANPCFLARIPQEELQKFFEGMGYKPYFVEGHEPEVVHQQLAKVLDLALAEIKEIWADARTNGAVKRPAWPMIVFRTPATDERQPTRQWRLAAPRFEDAGLPQVCRRGA